MEKQKKENQEWADQVISFIKMDEGTLESLELQLKHKNEEIELMNKKKALIEIGIKQTKVCINTSKKLLTKWGFKYK